MKKLITAALAGAGALAFAGTASAAPVVDGITTVEVTVDLGDIEAGLVGSATLADEDGLVVNFPVTGGDLDGLAGTIDHEGSGLTLTANDITVSLTNFTIDTVASTLSGMVMVDGSTVGRLDLFTFDLTGLGAQDVTNLDEPQIALLFTQMAADALANTFSIAALSALGGEEFGLAATAPVVGDVDVIPVPGAAILFVTGAAAFAARRRARA